MYSKKGSQKESRRVRRRKDYKGVDVAAGVIKIEKRKHLWQCQDTRERVSTKRSKENEVAVLLLDAEWVNKGKKNAKRKGGHNNIVHYKNLVPKLKKKGGMMLWEESKKKSIGGQYPQTKRHTDLRHIGKSSCTTGMLTWEGVTPMVGWATSELLLGDHRRGGMSGMQIFA